MTSLRLGVNLFSFTPEYHVGGLSLEQLLDAVASLDGPQHVELVGPQHLRGFPAVADRDAERLREALDRRGLTVSCLCGFVDLAADPRGRLDESGIARELARQIDAAAATGFDLLRVQHATTNVLRRLEEAAANAGVRLVVELNAPQRINDRPVQEMLELFDRTAGGRLGLLVDFAAGARRLADGLARAYRAKGASPAAIDLVWDHWRRQDGGDAHERRLALDEALVAAGFGELERRLARQAMILFGQEDPARWREILPHVLHAHVKLFEVDADGVDPCVPYDEIVPMLLGAGYDGVLSYEYEGWLWSATAPSTPSDAPPGIDAIRAHQRYVRRLEAEAAFRQRSRGR